MLCKYERTILCEDVQQVGVISISKPTKPETGEKWKNIRRLASAQR